MRAETRSAAAAAAAAPRPPLLGIIFSRGIVWRSTLVAVVVGTVLNAIAQGDFLVEGLPLNYWKICLTYCVPYVVATYGAVTARLETYRKQAEGAHAGGAA